MKALLNFAFSGISLIGTMFAILPSGSANASFTCGPHLKTYRVTSTNGALGGVRCVKFINQQGRDGNFLTFVWYGEGRWGNTDYRHVGSAAITESTGKQVNYAADISGNGEGTNGIFNRLFFRKSSDWQTIQVSGDWDEIWTLTTNNVLQDYDSRLQPLNSCGKNFSRYVVTDANNQANNGTGIRCKAKNGVWYGEGNWNGSPYAHIGFSAYKGIGASDICEPSRSRACGNFPIGSLKITGSTSCILPEKLRVQGAWNEIWTNNPSTGTCID
ncbi:MAG: hypothetical protein HC930_02790 [Hydrococcus sp. SU_1_0]|nr:hypothetical protein [Hydrococcus sp. SU_1_0]NJL64377.1 hypothetical protein [Candidatus Methylacidiphilales bacterium]NJR16215.1 hypothetical protein [Calothrix sp. CSU_2_0]